MKVKKITLYTVDWAKLIKAFNKNNVGQLTQTRLSQLFGYSAVLISLDKDEPKKLETLEKRYKETYTKLFESTIPFEELLIKTESFK